MQRSGVQQAIFVTWVTVEKFSGTIRALLQEYKSGLNLLQGRERIISGKMEMFFLNIFHELQDHIKSFIH